MTLPYRGIAVSASRHGTDALSCFRMGWLMQRFLPHVVVNQTRLLQSLVPLVEKIGRPTWYARVLKPGETFVPNSGGQDDLAPVPEKIQASLRTGIESLREECVKLRLKASHATLARILDGLDQRNYSWRALKDDADELIGRVVDELKEMTAFSVEGEAERLYAADQLFGAEVAGAFPGAAEDIAEAGKCLALDRGTACVMHLQRTLEPALAALGRALGITEAVRDWGKHVNLIGEALETRFRAAAVRTPDEQFYAEAHITFDAIRRAWRNPTMHIEKVYTVEHATDVFQAVRAFMRHLATRLTDA